MIKKHVEHLCRSVLLVLSVYLARFLFLLPFFCNRIADVHVLILLRVNILHLVY